jgi:hypothetical protein
LAWFQAAEETKKIMPGRAAETVSIIHFNDVYNVESREVGHFVSRFFPLKRLSHENEEGKERG